jgi:hypothetical protein
LSPFGRSVQQVEPQAGVAFGSQWSASDGKAARMPFQLHPHMLRHACGYKLANDGHDTRALQHYLGHKNIQHTVRYTELSPDRFRDFWRDQRGLAPVAGTAGRNWHGSAHFKRAWMCVRQMRPPGRGTVGF